MTHHSHVFLVSGASRGLGRAITEAALNAGHRVVAGVRRELEQARESQTAQGTQTRVRRDSKGRRLRASAYIYGPHGAKNARGRYHKRLPGVLRRVRTGQRLRVDGGRGTVRVV